MLETRVEYNKLGDCLEDPDHALSLVKPKKHEILKADVDHLLENVVYGLFAAQVAKEKLWHSNWDLAQDRRKQATLFSINYAACHVKNTLNETPWFVHLFECYPAMQFFYITFPERYSQQITAW